MASTEGAHARRHHPFPPRVMDRPHIRPRVSLRFPHPPEALQAVLDERLRSNARLEGRIRRQALLVWMAPELRHWWSPCLELTVEPDGDGTRLVGWYSARPQVMTAMLFGSILLSFLGLLSGCWATVQLTMGELPRCFLGTAGALGGLAVIYAANRLGQRWAGDQMHELAVLLQDLGAVEVDEAHAFG
jgi:hypothetical protein